MLEIVDLAKRYGPVVALDGATFAAPGRIVGFLGPTAPARRRRCAASSASSDPTAARFAGRAPRRPRGAPALRLHARAARPLPADAGRRAAQLLRPAARPVGHAGAPPAGALARAPGPGRPGAVQARGAVARQPAARPAGGGARARPGAARPRRALLGPRPARRRDDDRGHPRACRRGRRGRLLEPPARPRRGRLRGRRDHRARPRRRRGRDRRPQGARPAGSISRSRSSGSDGAWLDGDGRR